MATKTSTLAFATRNPLDEEVRAQQVELLDETLALLSDAYSQVKQAHWSVRGTDFIQLHELYDTVAEAILPHVDQVAERLSALGGVAHGTVRAAAAATTLEDYPADATSGEETVTVVADRLAACARHVLEALRTSDEREDPLTADLYTEIGRALELQLWFVESHLTR